MRTSRAVVGIAAGVAAGALLGVLLAPDSGVNTRKKIANKGQDVVDDLKSRFNSLVDGLTNHKEELMNGKQRASDHARKANA
ncbi:MAG TPA: YtxH domain-containing protein [Saprospiraceae bacterium]|nr:YtxH domain-containing protein [Saprospiraceae bacterium]